ncbi:hypothetical protein BE221DRAFT_60521, partial [Ostreococcus tauri]
MLERFRRRCRHHRRHLGYEATHRAGLSDPWAWASTTWRCILTKRDSLQHETLNLLVRHGVINRIHELRRGHCVHSHGVLHLALELFDGA